MEVPAFQEWAKFKDYKSLEGAGLPGVYVLAHFQRKPSSAPNLSSANIVYVGETTGQTIAKRLYQFSQSAFYRKNGHSGGWTYSNKCLEGNTCETAPEDLYVAILPVDRPHEESKAYIYLIERLVIWNYFQKNRTYPKCNTK